jgi:hypothetical protein
MARLGRGKAGGGVTTGNSNIEVHVTGPQDFHCFRLILNAHAGSQEGDRQPVEIMLHAVSLVDLIHKCSLALCDWQAQTSADLIERLATEAGRKAAE